MIYILTTIHVIVSLFLILVVLLQQGKGADLSVFGGGGTQTAFGARGAATLLHKLTVASFVAFIFTTVGIVFLKGGATSGSVMTEAPAVEATAEQEAAPAPEAAIPDTATPEAPGLPAPPEPEMAPAEGGEGTVPEESGGGGESASEGEPSP